MRIGLLFAVLVVQTITAYAQNGDAAAKAAVDDPSLSSNFAQLGQLTLVSTSDDAALKAEMGLEFELDKATLRTSLGVQAPVKKGAGNQELFSTLSGLGNGAQATIRVTRIGFGKDFDDSRIEQVCREFNQTVPDFPAIPTGACSAAEVRNRIDTWAGPAERKTALKGLVEGAEKDASVEICNAYNKAGAGDRIDDVADTCLNPTVTTALLKTAKVATKDCNDAPTKCWEDALEDKVEEKVKELCETLNSDVRSWGRISITDGETDCNTQRLTEAGPQWRRKAQDAIMLAPTYLSLSTTVGNDTFTYNPGSILNPDDFKKETKQGLAFTGTYGRLFLPGDFYAGLNFTVKRSYEGAKAVEICEAKPGTNQSICQSVATKAPSHSDSEVAQVELRRMLGTRVAITPRVGYDFNDKIWGGEVVTYLFQHEKNGLNGGIHLAYKQDKPNRNPDEEDQDNLSLAVFIGVPFQLFGQ